MKSYRKAFTKYTIFLILFSFFLYIVNASTPYHIVINEFDQNPEGNDNQLSIMEWVELYNPASEAVDISGWTLSSTSGNTITVTIPEGTVIEAKSFYVVNRGSQWLDNDGETIILLDASSNEVDKTPSLSDDDNDDWSWARYPNGQDANLDTDWRFQTSTKEESNGGEPLPPAPDPELEPEPEPGPESTPAPIPTIPSIPLTENVTVHFIDVGQGDSIFIDTPALDMLIDGGPRSAGETVLGYLQTLNVTWIDFLVATHPHADHIGGLITVLDEYNLSQIPVVIHSGYVATTVTYQDYISSVGSRTAQVAVRGAIIALDDGVEITILNPTSPLEFNEANDNSIVMMLRVYNVTFLFTGDSESPSEASILMAGLDPSSTILKVGHHGSLTSTSSEYLEVVNPEVAVISVGEGNRYGHPHQETVNKLIFEGVAIYRTDFNGSIEITTDGVDYSVRVHPETLLPAKFVISDLDASPESGFDIPFETGEFVILSVLVKNIGETSGTYTLEIKVDGETIDTQNVTLKGGGGRHARAYFEAQSPGTYQFSVGDLTENFIINAPLEPAEFEFSNFRIFYPGLNPPEVEAGQMVTVTVSIEVENVGEEEGGRTVELIVDGKVVDSKEVTLGGGASNTVLFELTRGEGTYEVEVEGFTESFTVNVQPEPRGIPGFPYASLILGLFIALIIQLRSQS